LHTPAWAAFNDSLIVIGCPKTDVKSTITLTPVRKDISNHLDTDHFQPDD
jgi:hypothetical protein